jgi:hypothetical protein
VRALRRVSAGIRRHPRPPRYAQARPGADAPIPRPDAGGAADVDPADDSGDAIDIDMEDEVEMPAALQLVELDHQDVERDFSQYQTVNSARDSLVDLISGGATRSAASAAPRARTGPIQRVDPLSTDEAVRRIRVAADRDAVSDAAIGFVEGAFGAGLMLIAKEQMALGHRGCGGRFDADTVASILIPLAAPSMFRTAIDSRRPFRGAPSADGKSIHDRLYKLFPLSGPPAEVIVVPIMVRDRVVCALYAHERSGGSLPERSVAELQTICADVSRAYLRLIRAAKVR